METDGSEKRERDVLRTLLRTLMISCLTSYGRHPFYTELGVAQTGLRGPLVAGGIFPTLIPVPGPPGIVACSVPLIYPTPGGLTHPAPNTVFRSKGFSVSGPAPRDPRLDRISIRGDCISAS
jgi:hypothetical protein